MKKILTYFTLLVCLLNLSAPIQAEEVKRVTIRSVGDILIHDTVYEDAWNGERYDFTKQFKDVKKYMENADLTTANLEVLAAGDQLPVSSYPFFNSPSSIIDALKDCGVDIVNNATNHTMDLGSEGAHASIKALKEREMPYFGSYESWDDYKKPRILESNGLKIGFLSYSYGANGNPIPADEEYLLTLIDEETIAKEVKQLKEQCDAVIVNFQMGEEYDKYPNDFQMTIANTVRDAGGNFVLGGHPHVMQPFIFYNPHQAGIFSHGNFLSGQFDFDTKIGGIIEYTFAKYPNQDQIIIEKMRLMPTYCHGAPDFAEHGVIPLADAQKYGIDPKPVFDELQSRMTYYTNYVEIVEYLD